MAYREPGVNSIVINARPNTGNAPTMVPLIIGEGPAYLDHELVPVVRSTSSTSDTIPVAGTTAVLGVFKDIKGTIAVNSSAYTVAGNKQSLNWTPEQTEIPAGTTYYVTVEARPTSKQYQPVYVSMADLDTAFDGMFMKSASGGNKDVINPVYLGAYLALENCQYVYALQVEPKDKSTYKVVDTDWGIALNEKAALLEEAYQIVPITNKPEILNAAQSHVNVMSSYEEKKERVLFRSFKFAAVPADGFRYTMEELKAIKTNAESVASARAVLPLAPNVTKTLSNGVLTELGPEYLSAALAGVDASIPIYRALTRQRVNNFLDLKYTASLRRNIANAVAESGVIVLTQAAQGAPVVVRHGVTTKMDNIQDREYSVVKIRDYCSKMIRGSLEGYIGVSNIDQFLITKIRGTMTATLTSLLSGNVITGWDRNSVTVAQDVNNPDTILIGVKIFVPYPCNYIDVTLTLE